MIQEREIDGSMAEYDPENKRLRMELQAAKELIQHKSNVIAALFDERHKTAAATKEAARLAEQGCRAKCRLYALFGALGMAAAIVAMEAW